ncbi:putative transcriptional regulator [Sorangium cellulosum So ce56]|uniref:Transcriptional regulator n=1 Tax=Sorangium cellulosum (strain So ce56) TaxID=448385 RepID=A9GP16_SORC5|nr:transcriptional regulator [Sorangium cellulosum]CAN96691.1 putative transcriptional regulator [Sorangium cellulosum So ce56]
MLTLIQQPDGLQGEGAPARQRRPRSPALRLTDVERMRLRAALRNLRALYGTWACLAEVMGVSAGSIQQLASGNGGSHSMALRAAKAAGVTLDQILGRPAVAGRCPACGRGAP